MSDHSAEERPKEATEAVEASCPACGSEEIDSSIPGFDPVCTDCGAVVTAPINFDDIPRGFEPESGSDEPWSDHYRVTNSTEYQIAQALESLESLGEQLGVSAETRGRAAEIYADAATEKLTAGRSTDLVVASCISIAGREADSPIPSSRIADIANSDQNSLRRICRILRKGLDIRTPACAPRSYLGDLAQTLELGKPVTVAADDLLTLFPEKRFGGKHPGAFAAAALYLTADGAVTQREVASAASVTTETIRLRIKECREVSESAVQSNPADETGDANGESESD